MFSDINCSRFIRLEELEFVSGGLPWGSGSVFTSVSSSNVWLVIGVLQRRFLYIPCDNRFHVTLAHFPPLVWFSFIIVSKTTDF
jgi:hypothetical protein